jgi:adenylosuccinate synthase
LYTAGIQPELDVYYMSRTYLTRHGAGPLNNEFDPGCLPYTGVKDETNIYNPHQQNLRFAFLEKEGMIDDIKKDLRMDRSWKVNHHLTFTCVDQLDDGLTVRFFEDGVLHSHDILDFSKGMAKALESHGVFISKGPTRKDIQQII